MNIFSLTRHSRSSSGAALGSLAIVKQLSVDWTAVGLPDKLKFPVTRGLNHVESSPPSKQLPSSFLATSSSLSARF